MVESDSRANNGKDIADSLSHPTKMFSKMVIVFSLFLSLFLCIILRLWNDCYSSISIRGSYLLTEHDFSSLFTQILFNRKPISNLGRFTNYHVERTCGWFSSGPSREFFDNTLNWITTIILLKLPISKFNVTQILDIIMSEIYDFKFWRVRWLLEVTVIVPIIFASNEMHVV
jgi:hypothetical protein